MKAQDIVDRLAAQIPLYTDAFSESLAITGISVVGTTATATAAGHGIAEGQNVAIINALAPVQIDTASFLRTGSQATFETLQEHDFTLSTRDIAAGGKTITLSGATEPEFNGIFQLLKVVNRNKLIIAVTDAGPTTISGSPIVEDANGEIFNGLFAAFNVTTDTFDYTLSQAYPLSAVVDNAKVQTSIRIGAVLDIEQYLADVYTKQAIGDDQLIVQLGDVTQSKKRNEETDASSSTLGEYAYTPILMQPFAVYIIQNSTQGLSASQLRDAVEETYVPAIFKAVLRARFPSGFSYNQYRVTFTGHGVFAYADGDLGKAVYVHEVAFEQLAQLDKNDTVGPDDNVAMRDISYSLTVDLGTGEDPLTADVSLDETPIT